MEYMSPQLGTTWLLLTSQAPNKNPEQNGCVRWDFGMTLWAWCKMASEGLLWRDPGPRNSCSGAHFGNRKDLLLRTPFLGAKSICWVWLWLPNPAIWETFEINHGWCHSQKGWYFHSWQSGKHQFSSSFAFIFLQSIGENTIFLYKSSIRPWFRSKPGKDGGIVQMHIIIQSLIMLNTDTKNLPKVNRSNTWPGFCFCGYSPCCLSSPICVHLL